MSTRPIMGQEVRYDYDGNKIKRIEDINAVVRAISRKLDVEDYDIEAARYADDWSEIELGIEDINAVVRAISRKLGVEDYDIRGCLLFS